MVDSPSRGQAMAQLVHRNAGVLVTLGTVIAIEVLSRTLFRVPIPGAILLVPVAYATFAGGLSSGLLSVLFMFLYTLYFFAIPGQPFQYTAANIQTIVLLTSVALAMVWMMGQQKQRIEQLNRYNQLILNCAGEGICGLDTQGAITFLNPSAVRMCGWRKEELIGQPMRVLTQPPHPGQPAVSRAAAPGDLVRQDQPASAVMEGVFWRKDGTSFPVEYINSPIWEQGKRMGAVVTFQDISERKQAEAALRQSEERFAKAFRASPVAFCVTRLEDGYFIDVNESFQRLYGYRRDELIGRKALDLNIYTNPTERAEIMRRVREQGSVRNYEMAAQAKSGELRRVLFSVEGMELEGEACIVATVIDITDRQRAEDEVRTLNAELEARVAERTAQLAVANQELAQANLAKDRFLASMSHELRTPLNAIIGFTGTLLMRLPGPLTADQEKQLRTIQTSARHLLSLINDLLDIAKIEAGQVELSRERIVCQEAIQEVAASLCPLAQAKGIGFDVLLPEDQIVLQADRRALNQILINLVNNAIKFTEHGSVQLGLRQRSENGHQLTEISVADTGIGIRLEDQAKLFRAFSQVDASDSRRHEGTGLGLHLSQKLAQLLGGQITVQSELGIGSTFTLALPD